MLKPDNVDTLCNLPSPYHYPDDYEGIFNAAMQEIVQYHCEYTPHYARWLARHGLAHQQLDTLHDWADLPPLFANYFKRNLVISASGQDALELTSSGTSGQKSRMRYDARSIGAAQRMVDRIFDYYGWHQPQAPCNYLLLSYEPAGITALGTAYTDQFLCKYAPVNRVCYALRHTGQTHEFDPFGVIQALTEFAAEGLPVRILGFPAFMWFVLERMREMTLPELQLHPDSLVFFGGGWKTHANKEVPKQQLYQRLNQQLGIAPLRCRDGYGSVEHPVPYVECANHHFHVPVYARAVIRDTGTFERMPYGKSGFLHFISPYITSAPAHSVVMSDLARLYPGADCGCGIATDWFDLMGRASKTASRSCALAASEFMIRD